MTNIIMVLVLIVIAAEAVRWAHHKFFSYPLDPEAERERHRRDLQRAWGISKWMTKQMFRR